MINEKRKKETHARTHARAHTHLCLNFLCFFSQAPLCVPPPLERFYPQGITLGIFYLSPNLHCERKIDYNRDSFFAIANRKKVHIRKNRMNCPIFFFPQKNFFPNK
jgi:hypothetical protein